MPIDDRSATPLALLFHELATDAAKYDALSTHDGTVLISSRPAGETACLTRELASGVALHSMTAAAFGESRRSTLLRRSARIGRLTT
jgi:two-component sensor histidine kinase